ncbi:hypothetical protein GCM10010425_09950 [Streptomyces spororaveus]|uniref:Uncharacterized protein n=2 Tax=Streptomyces TaxID=1883 RepID=A0ABQ3TNC6_9ACTN|nr:hypothetical protein [Streptomyces spororaveus]GHI81934.1 hypothetical protein Sspor_74950 [Streptomyces spororaveus]
MQAVVTARECGADGLAAEATDTLLGLGGALPCGLAWEDGLTEEEIQAADHAVRAEKEPAAKPKPGPDWVLSAACRKLGTDRPGLRDALEAFARSST